MAGGVSEGTYDLVPNAVTAYGAELVFHKVAQKPGKPLLLARKGRQLLFGLPGNPMSCHLCFHRYVAAAIRRMSGRDAVTKLFYGQVSPTTGPARAARPRRRTSTTATHFIPAWAEYVADAQTCWRIELLPCVTSADIFSPRGANCYVELPPSHGAAEAGELLPFTWFNGGPLAELSNLYSTMLRLWALMRQVTSLPGWRPSSLHASWVSSAQRIWPTSTATNRLCPAAVSLQTLPRR